MNATTESIGVARNRIGKVRVAGRPAAGNTIMDGALRARKDAAGPPMKTMAVAGNRWAAAKDSAVKGHNMAVEANEPCGKAAEEAAAAVTTASGGRAMDSKAAALKATTEMNSNPAAAASMAAVNMAAAAIGSGKAAAGTVAWEAGTRADSKASVSKAEHRKAVAGPISVISSVINPNMATAPIGTSSPEPTGTGAW